MFNIVNEFYFTTMPYIQFFELQPNPSKKLLKE